MKRISAIRCAVAAALLTQLWFCTDPTNVGADLLGGDQVGVDYTDTLTLQSAPVVGDTVTTYSPTTLLSNYLFGDFQDPVMGRSYASIYTEARLLRTISGNYEDVDFANATLDSVVLVLTYDTAGYYGNEDETYGIEVLELDESMDGDEYYTSDAEFATKPISLGSKDFVPNADTVSVIYYDGTTSPDTLKVFPHLRVPLSAAFGNRLLNLDTSIYKNDSAFISIIKGLHFKPTRETHGMLSFNVLSSLSGIYLYYSVGGLRYQYQFPFNNYGVTTSYYKQEYAGSQAEPYLNDALLGDNLTFVQAMKGVYTRVTIPHAEALGGKIINKAELTVTVAGVSGDNSTLYPSPDQLLIYRRNEKGKLVEIDDVVIGVANNSLNSIFGGKIVKGSNGQPSKYTMNLTTYFQDIVDGEAPKEIYLLSRFSARRAERTALCGAKHPTYPMQLKITYTNL